MKDMKVKIDICDPDALPHERCQYRTPTGRQCTRRVRDFESSYCPKHTASQLNDYDDIAPTLTENASKFLNAQGINYSLAALYRLLASGRISPRRASTLAYISSLLLRSLNAIDNDPRPNAGKDRSPSPEEGTVLAKATVNGKTVKLVATPTHTRVEPPIPPGKTPMPATRKEFAQQVMAHLKQNESDLPAYTLNSPAYKKLMANFSGTPPQPAPTTPPAPNSPSPNPSPPSAASPPT